ncbi:MAG: type 4a pilus biogenesis protein PilO [Candidatus Omnitrophota bacterium]
MEIKFKDKFSFKIPSLPPIDDKNRNWILGGAMLAIFLFDYFVIMQPFQLAPLLKMNPKIDIAKKNHKKALFDIKNVDQYKKDLEGAKEKMGEVGTRILSKEEIPKILDNISRLAMESNILINQIMPLKDSQKKVLQNDEGEYYSISILISVRGGYHELGHFINRVETDEIFMTINDFDVVANSNDSMRHSVKLTINAFILKKTEKEKS